MEQNGQRDKATCDVSDDEVGNYNGQDFIITRTESSDSAMCLQLEETDKDMNRLCDRIKDLRSNPALGGAAKAELNALMKKWQQILSAALSDPNDSVDSKSFQGSNANDNVDDDISPVYTLKEMEFDIPHSYPKMSSDMIENVKQRYKELAGMSNKASNGVARDSMVNLRLGKELCSDIVNEKLKLIAARSRSASGKLPLVYVIPYEVFSFLFNYKEEQEAIDSALGLCFINVHDMFKSDLIMCPLHFLQGNHWALAVVDLCRDDCIIIKYYDSIIDRGYSCQTQRAEESLVRLQKFLVAARKTSAVVGGVLNRDWRLEITKGVPQQNAENDVDCGVFILKFADYLSFGMELNFSQSHIPYFRTVMAWELFNDRMFLMPQQATIAVN